MFKSISKIALHTSLVAMLCCINPLVVLVGCNPPQVTPDTLPEHVYDDGLEYFEEEELAHIHRFVQLDNGLLEVNLRLAPQPSAHAVVDAAREATVSSWIASAHARSPDPIPPPNQELFALQGQLDLLWTPEGASERVVLLQDEPVGGHIVLQYRVVKNGFSGYKRKPQMFPDSISIWLQDREATADFLLSFYVGEFDAYPREEDDSRDEPVPPPEQDEAPEVDNPFARVPTYPVSRSMSLIYKTAEADVFVYTEFETDAADERGYWRQPRRPIEAEVLIQAP